MLATSDELEWVELSGKVATGAVGADQHAQAERVARDRETLRLGRAVLGCRHESAPVAARP